MAQFGTQFIHPTLSLFITACECIKSSKGRRLWASCIGQQSRPSNDELYRWDQISWMALHRPLCAEHCLVIIRRLLVSSWVVVSRVLLRESVDVRNSAANLNHLFPMPSNPIDVFLHENLRIMGADSYYLASKGKIEIGGRVITQRLLCATLMTG